MLNCINVVLVEPEIPQNTGNIARTCLAVGAKLHLIKPLGFKIENKYFRRAGLDYWHKVDIFYYDDINEFFETHGHKNLAFITKKSDQTYDNIMFSGDLYLVFGKETIGLPEDILKKNQKNCYRIPMKEETRSLNLATTVAIVAYEALRQNNFSGLRLKSNFYPKK